MAEFGQIKSRSGSELEILEEWKNEWDNKFDDLKNQYADAFVKASEEIQERQDVKHFVQQLKSSKEGQRLFWKDMRAALNEVKPDWRKKRISSIYLVAVMDSITTLPLYWPGVKAREEYAKPFQEEISEYLSRWIREVSSGENIHGQENATPKRDMYMSINVKSKSSTDFDALSESEYSDTLSVSMQQASVNQHFTDEKKKCEQPINTSLENVSADGSTITANFDAQDDIEGHAIFFRGEENAELHGSVESMTLEKLDQDSATCSSDSSDSIRRIGAKKKIVKRYSILERNNWCKSMESAEEESLTCDFDTFPDSSISMMPDNQHFTQEKTESVFLVKTEENANSSDTIPSSDAQEEAITEHSFSLSRCKNLESLDSIDTMNQEGLIRASASCSTPVKFSRGADSLKPVFPRSYFQTESINVGPEGRSFNSDDFNLLFPKNALSKEVEFAVRRHTDFEDGSYEDDIFPCCSVLSCEPHMQFLVPVTVKLMTWISHSSTGVQGYICQLEKNGKWVKIDRILIHKTADFSVHHFSQYAVFLDKAHRCLSKIFFWRKVEMIAFIDLAIRDSGEMVIFGYFDPNKLSHCRKPEMQREYCWPLIVPHPLILTISDVVELSVVCQSPSLEFQIPKNDKSFLLSNDKKTCLFQLNSEKMVKYFDIKHALIGPQSLLKETTTLEFFICGVGEDIPVSVEWPMKPTKDHTSNIIAGIVNNGNFTDNSLNKSSSIMRH